jgi:hypothetical protein
MVADIVGDTRSHVSTGRQLVDDDVLSRSEARPSLHMINLFKDAKATSKEIAVVDGLRWPLRDEEEIVARLRPAPDICAAYAPCEWRLTKVWVIANIGPPILLVAHRQVHE